MSNVTDEDDRTADHVVRRAATEASGASGESDPDRLDERLQAVERALTGSDAAVADLGDDAAAAAEREALESRVADLESRVEELEAATQAIRGYVGSIRAGNREVERRADLALARASRGEDDTVPSDAALDAAVPTDETPQNAAPATIDPEETGARDEADESWRDEALDRLRESV
jgi:chromosome segregation ATPase